MKSKIFGRIVLALAVSLGTGLFVTSCTTDRTVGYLWVTSYQYNEISGYRINNNFGQLIPSAKSPYPSGGVNPIRIVPAVGGKFLFVLNAGCGGTGQAPCVSSTSGCGGTTQAGCISSTTSTSPSIALFTVGGTGTLTYQQSYTSQGSYPVSIMTDTSGKYLLVLDSVAPDLSTCVAYNSATNPAPCGDITVFSIDSNTGRLSLVTNLQVKNSSGTNLTYFPVGSGPINFALSGTYVYTIEKGSGVALDPYQAAFVYSFNAGNGQLVLTQNTPIPTNAKNLTYVYASPQYIYLLDAGDGTTAGTILPFTAGNNGALQSVAGGAVPNTGTTADPSTMIVDHTGKFVYIANSGPNLTPTSPGSSVSAFFITPGTGLLQPLSSGAASNTVVFGSGASPRCILEDPSNQYLYTANYSGSTITGAIINQAAGTLTNLRKSSSFSTAGNPTWCVVSGTLF